MTEAERRDRAIRGTIACWYTAIGVLIGGAVVRLGGATWMVALVLFLGGFGICAWHAWQAVHDR